MVFQVPSTTSFTYRLPNTSVSSTMPAVAVAKLWQNECCARNPLDFIGASEGIRTLDTHVGNVMLYQAELRSLPCRPGQTKKNPAGMQAPFFWERAHTGRFRN